MLENNQIGNRQMKVAGIILAGGRSLRLGRNKALEPVSGKTLVEYVYEGLKPLAEQVLVVVSKDLASLRYPEGTEVLVDIYSGKGPLSGIYTGLTAAKYRQSIVVGCDMPFLNVKLLRYMVTQINGFDAVVPRLRSSMFEPLHAVYSRNCLAVIQKQLEEDELEIRALFNKINIRFVEGEECRKLDSEMLSFFNVNNQNDLDKAAGLVRRFEEAGK